MVSENDRSRGASCSKTRRSNRSGKSSNEKVVIDASDLAFRVTTALSALPIYGLVVTVEPGQLVRLEGTVRAERDLEQAGRAAAIPGVGRVVNALIVDPLAASMPINRATLSPELVAELELNHLHVADGTEIEFNERIGTTDTADATDNAEPYFAPTDPPTRRVSREDQGIEVVGGFSATSLDAPIDLEQLPRPLLTGDDEIAREVRLALRDDAATADLPVDVIVHRGVVRLRGVVQSLSDIEEAEEVASRVPNVVSVVDDLTVG